MKQPLGRLVGMGLILASTSASPALAAGELGLSLDGTHWSQSISTPLFDPSFRWVPGDSEVETFFVRNQGASPGDLTIGLLSPAASDLIDSGDLHVTAKGGGGAWTTVSQSGTHRLLSATDIAEGQVSPIKVTVSFDSTSTNATQLLASELTFRITLSGSAPRNDAADLPDTGAPDLALYAALSAILVGTGLGFVRRRNEAQREVHND